MRLRVDAIYDYAILALTLFVVWFGMWHSTKEPDPPSPLLDRVFAAASRTTSRLRRSQRSEGRGRSGHPSSGAR